MSTQARGQTHVAIYGRAIRAAWAQRFGVREDRLREVVTMVGSRITSVAAHPERPAA